MLRSPGASRHAVGFPIPIPRIYRELSKLRHDMNRVPHYEPTGDETFDRALSIPGAHRTS